MPAHFPSLAYALQLKGKTLIQIMDINRDCNIESGLRGIYCHIGKIFIVRQDTKKANK
jgi:hypothetical protein